MDENDLNNVQENQVTEEIVENPETKEEVIVERNIENNIERNVERTKIIEKEERGKKSKKKNNDTDVYIQYRKPSFFSGLLLILIGALIATIVILCLLVFVFKVDFNKDVEVYEEPKVETVEEDLPEEKPETTINKNLDLSVDGSFVKELYAKIPMVLPQVISYNVFKTTQNDLTNNQKMLYVLIGMRTNMQYVAMSAEEVYDRLEKVEMYSPSQFQVYKFDKEEVRKEYKKIFGSKSDITEADVETNMGYLFEYDEQDDCYYGHSYEGGGGYGYLYNTKIDSVETNKDKTEIYIYDYIIITGMGGNGDGKAPIYRFFEEKNPVASEEDRILYQDEKNSRFYVKEEYIDKYKDKLVRYKHTYKLDDTGNYYWYSAETANN